MPSEVSPSARRDRAQGGQSPADFVLPVKWRWGGGGGLEISEINITCCPATLATTAEYPGVWVFLVLSLWTAPGVIGSVGGTLEPLPHSPDKWDPCPRAPRIQEQESPAWGLEMWGEKVEEGGQGDVQDVGLCKGGTAASKKCTSADRERDKQ